MILMKFNFFRIFEKPLKEIYKEEPYIIQKKVILQMKFNLIYIFFFLPSYILINWPNWSYITAHSLNTIILFINTHFLFKKRYRLASDLLYFLYFGNYLIVLFPMASGPEVPEILYRTTITLILFATAINLSSYRSKQIRYHIIASIVTLITRYFVIIKNTTAEPKSVLFHLIFALILTISGDLVIDAVVNYYSDLLKKIELQEKQLVEAMTKIINGFIPICANCKSIKQSDNWIPIEQFLKDKTNDVQLSHGICPECAKKLYPYL